MGFYALEFAMIYILGLQLMHFLLFGSGARKRRGGVFGSMVKEDSDKDAQLDGAFGSIPASQGSTWFGLPPSPAAGIVHCIALTGDG